MQTTSKDTSAPPQQIGPYQVMEKIGQGGMGVVYRARDLRLDRDVALKVLPPAFATDPTRMARFEREAKLLASLNHPKIAAVYGVEGSGSTCALVMELVEGPTLAERIVPAAQRARPRSASGTAVHTAVSGTGAKAASTGAGAIHARAAGLPLDEALPIAQQIAEALEYAHDHGVINRDLKPANIKVMPDGGVKVLDFGLAKAIAPEETSADTLDSPTLSLAMTQAGFILGTAAYMSPEQVKQRPVDRRADIWAFGCVLYEMLSGKMAFRGETVTDTLAEIVKSEPDWAALPADTPPAIRNLMRRCLVKEPRQRLRDIGDARIAIEETLSGASLEAETEVRTGQIGAASSLRRALPWALGTAAVLLAAFAAWLLLRPKQPRDVVRLSVPSPANLDFYLGGEPSISPDGRYLAFVTTVGGSQTTLWVRRLDSLTAVEIPGTEGAFMPFWSPDSQWIGFEAGSKLEKVAASGGPAQTLFVSFGNSADVGASWNRNGAILFANGRGLYRVADTGGTPTVVLPPDPVQENVAYEFPQFLPDGRHFIFAIVTSGGGGLFTATGSLDSQTFRKLTQSTSEGAYAPPGYLFYLDQSTLMARPFDANARRFTGPAAPVAQNVGGFSPLDYGYFSVSPAGVLAYQPVTPGVANSQMTWFSRGGQKLGTVGQPNDFSNPALSPDGTRLAICVGDFGKDGIWVYDLKRGTASRLTFDSSNAVNPVWTPDGSRMFFSSARSGFYGIYQHDANGLGGTQKIFQSRSQSTAIDDITADGRLAIYDTATSPSTIQLWALPLAGGAKPFAFVQGSFGAGSAQFSPNGRFVAYSSGETGRREIYVQTFPQHTGKWQISASGGVQPMWRRDGKELFYLTLDEKLMSVNVDTSSASFQAGIPKELFQPQLVPTSYWRNIYVPSLDGQRFLMLTPAGQVKPLPITEVVNWPALLKSGN